MITGSPLGGHVANFGGNHSNSDDGTNAGTFYFNANNTPSNSNANHGAHYPIIN